MQEVSAQIGTEEVSAEQVELAARLDAALSGENDTQGMNMNEEAQQETEHMEFADHGYSKSIFTKKLPDPVKVKRRKKIAAASRRRNRRA